jgi:PPM family protein phosphatase
MRTMSALKAAGATDPGRYREVNEDRFHVDAQRGLFLVVDGVGGQAAGGKAADTAIVTLRARLEREIGSVPDRVRDAITAANNEIHRLASTRAEWAGMACVLTVAVVNDGHAVIGHVGDTRLYKIRNGRIGKITRDHSPVGEREDSGELSELDAMRHPRRNEVYRDVGSEPHRPSDPDFIDIVETPFETDAALLVCSDGLTDLVSSSTIHEIVSAFAGNPDEIARALVAAANDAGGKDNVTVVYVEGDEFSPERTRPLPSREPVVAATSGGTAVAVESSRATRVLRITALVVLALVIAAAAVRLEIPWPQIPWPTVDPAALVNEAVGRGPIVVRPSDSIRAAMDRASAGATVIVEPGEYRERIVLKEGVRLVSRESRGAIIRLPSDASETDPAVIAEGILGAELTGFRIVGDSATPLGTGLAIRNATIAVSDVEITGAKKVALDISGLSSGTILGVDAHDNPGAAIRVGSGATPRITHSSFMRNGTSAAGVTWLIVETGAHPRFSRNVFHGAAPTTFVMLDSAARAQATRDNWFVDHAPSEAPSRGRTR